MVVAMMERSRAQKGQRVRATVDGVERAGVIHLVGDRNFRGIHNLARVVFRDNPEVGAQWVPIKDLREETN